MDLAERRANSRRHPWELARSDHFRQVIREATAHQSVETLLDIGAGDGWFAQELIDDVSPTAAITCWDINYTADDLNALLPARVRRTSDTPTGEFDLVLMLDLLEHIELDEEFLQSTVLPLLAPNGTLIVSVPAHQALFSAHDVALGHFRRYRPRQISKLLGRHFDVVREGSLFTSLVPLRGAEVLLERARAKRGRDATREVVGVGKWQGGDLATRGIRGILRVDAALARQLARVGASLPGLSYWAVCSKR
jgi:SAM-dependent methyltransferase